ncbi:MAG: cytochrome b [Erythrobacter sp.]
MSRNTTAKYSGLAMLLHWGIGALVIAQWLISEAAEDAPSKAEQGAIMANHFSLGAVIFVLVAVRLIWRQVSPPPASLNHSPWERTLAKVVHYTFYALLLVMPMAGWVAMSSFGEGVGVFGLFTLPPLPVGVDPARGEAIFELHGTAGIALLVLIAFHALAALKHQFVDKDGTLFRMLPFGTVRD